MKYQDSGSGDWRLSKLGFKFGLFWLVSFLTQTGMIISIVVLFLTCLPVKFELMCEPKYWSRCIELGTEIYYYSAGFAVPVSIFWLLVCYLLRRRNNQRNIGAIEKISKTVNYINAILELFLYIVVLGFMVKWYIRDDDWHLLTLMIPIMILMVFTSIRLHGIRTQNNFLMCIYVISRYITILLTVPATIGALVEAIFKLKSFLVFLILISVVIGKIYVLLDTAVTVIYYNIMLNHEKFDLTSQEASEVKTDGPIQSSKEGQERIRSATV